MVDAYLVTIYTITLANNPPYHPKKSFSSINGHLFSPKNGHGTFIFAFKDRAFYIASRRVNLSLGSLLSLFVWLLLVLSIEDSSSLLLTGFFPLYHGVALLFVFSCVFLRFSNREHLFWFFFSLSYSFFHCLLFIIRVRPVELSRCGSETWLGWINLINTTKQRITPISSSSLAVILCSYMDSSPNARFWL